MEHTDPSNKRKRMAPRVLPSDVLAQIFSRLPMKSIMICRCVCKTWFNVISKDSYFARLYSFRKPSSVILQPRYDAECEGVIYLENPEDDLCATSKFDEKKPMKPFFRIPKCGINEDAPEGKRLIIKNSCNGLLYLEEDHINAEVSIVCNPITNEFIVVPKYVLENGNRKLSRASSWLGFSPQTNQFKILTILGFVGPCFKCAVHDLGSDSWRCIKDDSGYPSAVYRHLPGIFLNGSIHWIPEVPEVPAFILSFDFGKEKFGEVLPPPEFGPRHSIAKGRMSIGVLRGCLCISDQTSCFRFLTVWIMKWYGVQASWNNVFKISLRILNPQPRPFEPFHLFKLLELSNGIVFIVKINQERRGTTQSALLYWDPNSKNRIEEDCFEKLFNGIIHTPRFESLKNIVSDELKVHSGIRVLEEGEEISAKEGDLVVGKVYSKIMETESRILPCGRHVIGEPPSAMEAVATLVNIAALDRPEDGICALPAILAQTVGREIEDVYRGSDKGTLRDMELLTQITEASRGAVTAFVEQTTNKKGQVVDVSDKLTSILGFGINEPWVQYLSNTKFYRADRVKLRMLFEFLGQRLKLFVADNELGSLKQALEGKYVELGPSEDPIRNPKVLPTGKNIPTTAAMQSAKIVVDRLIERQKADNGGKYPETVTLVLWGTDNIKAYGESLAQVLWMIGVRPVADTFGRVNRVETASLEELGRPRIDVVVNCSGLFRDLFINQMNLLDRAIKMVAELDEPEDQNFVRKHALEQAKELGIEVREAATRVFSNASGSYFSNINLAVEDSSWNDEKQLQDMYLSRKSFAFDCDAPGAGMTQKRKAFEMALSTADATFQNLGSSEISLTDVSHYFDSDPTNLVQNLKKDGKKPSAYIADTTTANAQVRTLSETVRLDARTKLLNPKWYEGRLSTGYEGVREIEKRLTNTVGWSATSGQVDNWVYEEANTTFIQDEEMLNRLMSTNPNSFRKLVQTFLEANGRGYWETSADNVEKLRQLYSEVEDKINGIDR